MQLAMIGLGRMGGNMAKRIAAAGHEVVGYDRSPESDRTVASLEEMVAALTAPRIVWVMVPAGEATDSTINELAELLEPGDMIIDGGNSRYTDDARHAAELEPRGIHFMDCGVSGGVWGIDRGYALMVGGSEEDFERARPIFEALKPEGDSGLVLAGPVGGGHFAKMVHNGIEYGDMQLICEAYYLMKRLLHLSPDEIADYFRRWNLGELSSYLMEISAHILTVPDPETGAPLVDQILGEAGSKGTGMWTVQEALSLGVPLPTIAQAVFARDLSCRAQVRAAMSRQAAPHELPAPDRDAFAEKIRRALYASKLCSYAQGFELLHQASQHYHWDLDLGGIALLFRGGCIIRAAFLDRLAQAYRACPTLENLLLSSDFASVLTQYQSDWRDVVSTAAQCGVAVPAFSASLSYYDGLCDPAGPLNLLQAQRDCFGAHTFRRIDRDGSFHHNW